MPVMSIAAVKYDHLGYGLFSKQVAKRSTPKGKKARIVWFSVIDILTRDKVEANIETEEASDCKYLKEIHNLKLSSCNATPAPVPFHAPCPSLQDEISLELLECKHSPWKCEITTIWREQPFHEQVHHDI